MLLFVLAMLCPAVNVAFASANTSDSSYGARVELTCDAGYLLSMTNQRSGIIECNADGQWEPNGVVCHKGIDRFH